MFATERLRPSANVMLRGLISAIALFPSSGCAPWLARPIEVALPAGQGDKFDNCLRSHGGVCGDTALANDGGSVPIPSRPLGLEVSGESSPALVAVRDVEDSPVQQELIGLYNDLAGAQERTAVERGVSVRDLAEYGARVERATALGGWDAASEEATAALVERMRDRHVTSLGANSLAGRPDLFESYRRAVTATYVKAYVKAYFRGGKFASLTVDHAQLKERIQDELGREFPFADESELPKKVAGEIEKRFPDNSKTFGEIGSEPFVTRDGSAYQFPGLDARLGLEIRPRLTSDTSDAAAVGTDLVRVVLEALFDANNALPAVGNATGVLDLPQDARLAVFEPNAPPYENMSEDDFAAVKDWANRAEGTASAAFGRVVRGAGWLSLNNESLARLLETAVGVTVRKASEKLTWCAYACDLVDESASSSRSIADPHRRRVIRYFVNARIELRK